MFTKNKCEDRDEKNNLKLTVIVPTYNVEDYISRCLDSLLNQDDQQIIRIRLSTNIKKNMTILKLLMKIIKVYIKRKQMVLVLLHMIL